jgi:PadR family transcriptional regulator PadR
MEAENGKKRTYYRITDEGRKYYQEKCEEWQLTKEVIENFISV